MASESSILLGNLVRLESLTGDDLVRHPIWVNDLSGESSIGFDETSIRPVLEEVSVTRQLARQYAELSIALQDTESDALFSANYRDDGQLECVATWKDEKWIEPVSEVVLKAIPTVEGRIGLRFKFNPDSGRAVQSG